MRRPWLNLWRSTLTPDFLYYPRESLFFFLLDDLEHLRNKWRRIIEPARATHQQFLCSRLCVFSPSAGPCQRPAVWQPPAPTRCAGASCGTATPGSQRPAVWRQTRRRLHDSPNRQSCHEPKWLKVEMKALT